MRQASICVGIVDYDDTYYRDNHMRLRFATSDAEAFHSFLEQGPASDTPPRRILLKDGEATSKTVAAAFVELAEGERVDLLIVYLSGHGERGNEHGGWFCLADASAGTMSFGGGQLDAMLHQVDAARTLVIVDCCHAEALFQHSRYFVQLGSSMTRLFMASARVEQRAWEATGLNRSVFSDVLLKGCSNQLHLQDSSGLIDVERNLFPFVREQVVLLALSKKNGAIQEPVTGGVAAMPLLLHSVSGSAFGRPVSLAETLRARLRQILVGSFSLLLLAIVLVHELTFHLVADSSGNIQVRTGLESTASLMPAWLVGQIDTGYAVSQLNQSEQAFMSELARGEVRGIASHVDDLGLSAWSTKLVTHLNASAGASYAILVRGQPTRFDATWSGPPRDEAQFLFSHDPNMSATVLDHLYADDLAVPPDCMSDPGGKIDFTSLNPSSKVASEEILWWSLRAGQRADEIMKAFNHGIARAAYRAIHSRSSAGTSYEASYLVLAIQILAERATNDTRALMQQQAIAMLDSHCRLHAALVLATLAPDGRSGAALQGEKVLAQEIGTYNRVQQGSVGNVHQELAVMGLMLLAQRRPLNDDTLRTVTTLLEHDIGDIGGGSFPQSILMPLAERQALPTSVLTLLDARLARTELGADSFEVLGIARVLSRNVRFLSSERKLALKRLLIRLALTNQSISDFHEALGFAGLVGPEISSSLATLSARLSPGSLFAVPASSYRGDVLISSTGDAAAIALGRLAQNMVLPPKLQERLSRLAAVRADLPQRQALVAGLAFQRYGDREMIADEIYSNLAAGSNSTRLREFEIEVACTALLGRPRQVRETAATRLMAHWNQESAPELRQALAITIGRSRFPAVGQLTLCRKLPDQE